MKALGAGTRPPRRVVQPLGRAAVDARWENRRRCCFARTDETPHARTPADADAGSAWFAFAEGERETLEVGKLADLAVLSKDYFKVPAEEIGEIEAVMTVVGGRVVYEKR